MIGNAVDAITKRYFDTHPEIEVIEDMMPQYEVVYDDNGIAGLRMCPLGRRRRNADGGFDRVKFVECKSPVKSV